MEKDDIPNPIVAHDGIEAPLVYETNVPGGNDIAGLWLSCGIPASNSSKSLNCCIGPYYIQARNENELKLFGLFAGCCVFGSEGSNNPGICIPIPWPLLPVCQYMAFEPEKGGWIVKKDETEGACNDCNDESYQLALNPPNESNDESCRCHRRISKNCDLTYCACIPFLPCMTHCACKVCG